MGSDNSFNTSLSLGLGNKSSSFFLVDQLKKNTNPSFMSFDHTFPSLTLGLSSREAPNRELDVMIDTSKKVEGESTPTAVLYRQSSSISGVSTFSNSSVKRERDVVSGGEEFEVENISSKDIDQDDQEGGARKKLRLTKDQSLVLEESFKEHSTLNPKQKQALAKHLNLRPRQVEVWFQNRRARTKLKQNEVDCELLKKCCESLTEENRRLEKEIKELNAIKIATPPTCYMQFPAATLTMCPSCERITGVIDTNSSSKSPFSKVKPHFLRLLNHPSAAPC